MKEAPDPAPALFQTFCLAPLDVPHELHDLGTELLFFVDFLHLVVEVAWVGTVEELAQFLEESEGVGLPIFIELALAEFRLQLLDELVFAVQLALEVVSFFVDA